MPISPRPPRGTKTSSSWRYAIASMLPHAASSAARATRLSRCRKIEVARRRSSSSARTSVAQLQRVPTRSSALEDAPLALARRRGAARHRARRGRRRGRASARRIGAERTAMVRRLARSPEPRSALRRTRSDSSREESLARPRPGASVRRARSPDRAGRVGAAATLTPKPITTANAPPPIRCPLEQEAGDLAAVEQAGRSAISARERGAGAGPPRRRRAAPGRRRSRAAARARRRSGSRGGGSREVARRRGPGPAVPAAPGGLLGGDDQSGPRSPCPRRAPRRRRWSIVVSSGRAGSRPLRPRARDTRHPSEQRARRGAGRADEGRRNEPEQQHDGARERRARPSAPSAIGSKRPPRLVEVHDLDDANVVVGADDARHDADDGERHERWPGSRRRRRRTWRRSRRAAGCRRARTSSRRSRRP